MQNMSGGKTALGLDANIGALLCYLGNLVCALGLIYSIIVLVQDKTNKLVRFHAFQSIFLSLTGLVIGIPFYIILFVGIFIDAKIGFPLITGIIVLILIVISIALLVFTIMAAIKAFNGQIYKIPVIGNFADKYSS